MDECNELLCVLNKPDLIITAVATIVASLIGAYFGGRMTRKATIEGVKQAHYLQIKADEEAERKLINGFIWAIHAEVTSLLDRYMETMGSIVEASDEDSPLAYHYLIQEGYLAIFNNNTNLIGRINDGELRSMIVQLYTLAKGMIDTFRTNSEFTLQLEKINTHPQFNSKTMNDNVIRAHEERLVSYANQIRFGHWEFKQLSIVTLKHIEETVPKT